MQHRIQEFQSWLYFDYDYIDEFYELYDIDNGSYDDSDDDSIFGCDKASLRRAIVEQQLVRQPRPTKKYVFTPEETIEQAMAKNLYEWGIDPNSNSCTPQKRIFFEGMLQYRMLHVPAVIAREAWSGWVGIAQLGRILYVLIVKALMRSSKKNQLTR